MQSFNMNARATEFRPRQMAAPTVCTFSGVTSSKTENRAYHYDPDTNTITTQTSLLTVFTGKTTATPQLLAELGLTKDAPYVTKCLQTEATHDLEKPINMSKKDLWNRNSMSALTGPIKKAFNKQARPEFYMVPILCFDPAAHDCDHDDYDDDLDQFCNEIDPAKESINEVDRLYVKDPFDHPDTVHYDPATQTANTTPAKLTPKPLAKTTSLFDVSSGPAVIDVTPNSPAVLDVAPPADKPLVSALAVPDIVKPIAQPKASTPKASTPKPLSVTTSLFDSAPTQTNAIMTEAPAPTLPPTSAFDSMASIFGSTPMTVASSISHLPSIVKSIFTPYPVELPKVNTPHTSDTQNV